MPQNATKSTLTVTIELKGLSPATHIASRTFKPIAGKAMRHRTTFLVVCVLLFVSTGAGCKSGPELVSAPNLYTDSSESPYVNVPAELQSNIATVLYATDRDSETVEGVYGYSAKRSRRVAFGLTAVRMGEPETTWDQLVTASCTRKRPEPLPLTLTNIDERGAWPPFTPPVLLDGHWVDDPSEVAARAEQTAKLHALLAERLALTPRKEVFLFVHGYANTFESGAFRASQIWHFTGRGGVPVLFSWPAGRKGLLRGYTGDRESGEFANPHLKMFIRDLASCPEVEKVHLIAHSRGTDILATALRELHLETRCTGHETKTELKLGQLVLAAPDIDLDVFVERFGADRVGYVPEQLTIYVSPNDKAIGLSNWLFGSARRIGQLALGDLGNEYAAVVKTHPVLSIVDVRAKTLKQGHGYFLDNPAALSDLILVLRDGRRPGAANGRPLFDAPDGFLQIQDGYPTSERSVADRQQPTQDSPVQVMAGVHRDGDSNKD
jgi:esterase/lipase superfamily enzyme